MDILAPVTTGYLAQPGAVASFDARTIRMLDPLYRDANGEDPNKSDLPPVGLLGGDNTGIEALGVSLVYGTNTVRIGISPSWFDANNEMPAAILASIRRYVTAGLKIVWLYANHHNSETALTGTPTNDEKVASLNTYCLQKSLTTFVSLRAFLMKYQDLRKATLAIELFNEPAIYNIYKGQMTADAVYGADGFFENLFADHCIMVIDALKAWWGGIIMLPLFRYNANGYDLLKKSNSVSALDRMRRRVGREQCVWSLHAYPGWVSPFTSEALVTGVLRKTLGPIARDRICLTETNITGTSIVDHPPETAGVPNFARSLHWLRRRGIGMGYFPAFNTGASSLATFNGAGAASVTHPWALAECIRAFACCGDMADGTSGAVAASVQADYRDPAGMARSTQFAASVTTTIRRDTAGTLSGVSGTFNIMIGCNPSGGHTLRGVADATRSFLAVCFGNNTLEANSTSLDVLRGGIGSNTFNLSGANAQIDGGGGSSIININSGVAFINTGAGVCLMNFASYVAAHFIYDLKAIDTISLSAWGGSVTVIASGANVVITGAGGRTITCYNTTVAAVTPRITGVTVS